MNQTEVKELTKVLVNLNNKLNEEKPSKWVDWGMRVAATISTAGILAVFALFFTTIPSLKQAMSEISLRQSYIKEDLGKLSAEPRFSLKDYNLYEKEKDSQRNLNTARLDQRRSWMDAKDKIDNDQSYKIQGLEKQMDRVTEKLKLH